MKKFNILSDSPEEEKIMIENENPDISGGKRVVSDAVHSERDIIKETIGVETKA